MDIIDIAIAKKLAGGGGGGSDLPEVNAEDNGKVLAVNASGEWAADEYPWYDLVFNVLHDDYSATLIKGNLDSIVAKAKAGKPISVYGITDYGDGFYYGMTIDRIEVDYSVVGDEYVRVRAAQSHFMSGGYVAAGSPCTIIFDANGIEGSFGWS